MIKWFSLGFWELIARVVLRNRILMLSIVVLTTVLLAMQWKNIHFTHTEANMLPDDNIVNVEYNAFLDKFGEEGNLVIIGVAILSALLSLILFFLANSIKGRSLRIEQRIH